MIKWRNKWDRGYTTLLHEIVGEKSDPPLELMQMIIHISPGVHLKKDINGYLPLHRAICTLQGFGKKTGNSMDVIKFLVDADDQDKKTLMFSSTAMSNSAILWCVFRGDQFILNYLLSFPQCQETLLVPDRVNSRTIPLYYSSRDHAKNGHIMPFLQILLKATATQLGLEHSCCLLPCIAKSSYYIYDEGALRKLAYEEGLVCSVCHGDE